MANVENSMRYISKFIFPEIKQKTMQKLELERHKQPFAQVQAILPRGVTASKKEGRLTISAIALGLHCDTRLREDDLIGLTDKQIKERIIDPAISSLNDAAHEKFD